MAALLSGPPVRAQCPGPPPAFSEIADQDPQFLQTCVQLRQPCGCCRYSDAPVLDSAYPVLAQEATLRATVPDDFIADSVFWKGSYFDSTGVERELWTPHESTEGAPFAPGTTVDFGAPGLVPETEHKFRVSFCDASGCFCYSAKSAGVTTVGFAGGAPDPPANAIRETEDTFTRPTTTATGDSLGPSDIWMAMEASIVDTDGDGLGDSAFVSGQNHAEGAAAVREFTSGETHAYAEALIRNDLTNNSEYNFEVSARIFSTPGPMSVFKSYYVKLAKESGTFPVSTLVIGRAVGPSREDIASIQLQNITGQPNCPANVDPLEQEQSPGDPGDRRSLPVWLRIEVADVGDEPIITGTVAWDCASGEISACGSVCFFNAPDAGDPHLMANKQGMSGMGYHHKSYFVDTFREVSIPPTP